MKLPAVAIASALLAAVASVFVVFAALPSRPPSSTLSDRINAVCPPGYEPTDWEVDGEFTNIPPDTVRVSCTAWNKTPTTIYRSVTR